MGGRRCEPDCKCGKHVSTSTVCPHCKIEKTRDDFYSRTVGGRVKRSPWCKLCTGVAGRQTRMLTVYSLTLDEYDQILASQQGTCAICDTPPKNVRLAVDHDHKTGLIRGLLCWACNAVLGRLNDDPSRLRKAADYVDNPPAVTALGREVYGRKGRVKKKPKRKRKKT